MSQSKLTAQVISIFKPPFKGLAALVWIYFVLCLIFHPNGSVLRGDLPDTDDYTYLNQVLDWLQGQTWFDNVQYRLSPPEGVRIHFTRIIQIPLAMLIMFFKAFGLPWRGAATLTAMLWPLMVFAGFLASVRWAAKSFLPRDWTGVTAYTTLFSVPLLFQFSMGHIDHHGVESILLMLSFGCMVRMMETPSEIKWGALAGFIIALALAVALEVLPWVVALSAFAGLWLMVKGSVAARSGVVFGLTLYLSSIAFLIAYKAPGHWLEVDVVAYSVVYVILAASIAFCFVGTALAAQTRFAWLRYFSGIGLCAVTAALFFSYFPELLSGPYGAADKEIVRLFFENISEAMPLARHGDFGGAVLHMLVPLLALGTSLGVLYKAKGNEVWVWFFLSLLIGFSIVLAVFYQMRMIVCAYLFGIIPLAVLLHRGWIYIGSRYRGRRQFWMELGLILLVGPLPMVLMPAVFDGRPMNIGVGMFPVQYVQNRCNMSVLDKVLNSPKYFGGKSLTIMNTIDSGPELIFRSSHKVMSAPYHTNIKGNKDSMRFFSTSDPAEAEAIARDSNIDLVVICRRVPRMYFKEAGLDQIEVTPEGKVEVKASASFVESLIYRKLPPWLKEVNTPAIKQYLVFEVLKDKLSNPTPAH